MRIGLIGWGSATGNGGMNGDIARLSPNVVRWLAPKHPKVGYHEPYMEAAAPHCEIIRCAVSGEHGTYGRFLDGLDAVLFVELPYLQGWDVVGECRKRGIKTMCIPMYEWWPRYAQWMQQVDSIWCVTPFTVDYCRKHSEELKSQGHGCEWADRIFGDRWGVDLEEFQFQERTTAERILFANGNGGCGGRKGAQIVIDAAQFIRDIPITILSQNDSLPKSKSGKVTVTRKNFATRRELYEHGDVFLAPSYWEGLGHQLYEAQACGLPVLASDYPPMNQCGTELLIPLNRTEPVRVCGKSIQKAVPSCDALAKMVEELYGSDVRELSRRARQRIEQRHDLRHVLCDLESAISSVL